MIRYSIKDLPNLLTASRIIVIPFIIFAMLFDNSMFWHRVAAILFLYASFTDFLDGYLARSMSLQSNLGKFLDPVADKLLVGAVIVVLVYYDRAGLFPSIAIICREILVSGLREFLADLSVSVPVSKLSKIKTLVQMVAIFILILGKEGSGIQFADTLGNIALWIAAILTLVTGYAYLKMSFKYFRRKGG
jgi:CDP-diacylglycerol--glycerol-3-phosphate 3-phosphatidyltransferase